MPGDPRVTRHAFEARARAAAEAGFTGLCLHFRDYEAQIGAGIGEADLCAILAAHGLVDNSIEFLRDWFEPTPSAEANIALALKAAACFRASFISVGADLGSGTMPVAAMGPRFAALCTRAREEGVDIALEIVAWSNVHDVVTARELLAFAGPEAGLVIDSWHIFRGGVGLETLEALEGRQIKCIQLNDAGKTVVGPLRDDTMHRLFCGQGVFDLVALLDRLAGIGVDAPICVEVIAPEVADMAVSEVTRIGFETTMRIVAASQMMARSEA